MSNRRLFNAKVKYAVNPLPNVSTQELLKRCNIPGFKVRKDPFVMKFGIGAGSQRVALDILPFGAAERDGAAVGYLELRDDGEEVETFLHTLQYKGSIVVDDLNDRPTLLAAMIRGCEKAERDFGEFDEEYAKELYRERNNPPPESDWPQYRRKYASFIYNGERAKSIRKWITVLEKELDKAKAEAKLDAEPQFAAATS